MALKPDRNEHLTDLSFFMNETGERGKIVMFYDVTAGSGSAMDSANQRVNAPTGTVGADFQPAAGLLLNDVVNLDLTRQHLNFQKDEVQIGSKVLLLTRGFVVTNNVSGTPVAADVGKPLYVASSVGGYAGNLTLTNSGGPKVGRLLSIKDEDGYAKVDIDVTWQ